MIYYPEIASRARLLEERGLTEILRRRLVFTVCTGRCGTQTWAELFSCVENAVSLHEPSPAYDSVLRSSQRNAERALEFLIEQKIPRILDTPADLYVETSHLVCKGFIEPWLELGVRPTFLFIERDFSDVAYSFYLLNSVPEVTDLGRNFMLSPADPGLVQIPDWQDMNEYQLCYWYCIEMHRRARLYRRLFDRNGIPYVNFAFHELQNVDTVRSVLEALTGRPAPDTDVLRRVASQKHNIKSDDKIARARTGNLQLSERQQYEAIVRRMCELAESLDDLPVSPQLTDCPPIQRNF